MPRLALQINLTLMVILVPLILVLASKLGAVGGALAWLTLHSLYVLVGTYLTHRKLLVGIGTRWLLGDVGVPLALSVVIVLAGRQILRRADMSPLLDLAAVPSWCCCGGDFVRCLAENVRHRGQRRGLERADDLRFWRDRAPV